MSGVQGGEAAARYTVLLAHEGCLPAMIPSPSVSRFYSCIKDEAEYDVTPVRPYPAIPLAVTLEDRESTVHTAELLHLRSLQSWNPHRDRIKFLRQAALRERAEDTAGEEDTDGVLVL
ncbi:hypothetical protein AGDE_15326 [Angomonas deanei]|uniref:Uncharacterized protein n=1 Tax=Angomonas deanei TaxID=59799 RepID=A0A7G2C910_9TRYP|nr:hypothetical protein AGDE_15326 [Angomonas deanei]CAD2215604.1 hypothetical protein, conserved [Angomonas deanei]|eukprot:EPY19263.1 hypothetical protein AGDE_15326 [Angomonas deanei]